MPAKMYLPESGILNVVVVNIKKMSDTEFLSQINCSYSLVKQYFHVCVCIFVVISGASKLISEYSEYTCVGGGGWGCRVAAPPDFKSTLDDSTIV